MATDGDLFEKPHRQSTANECIRRAFVCERHDGERLGPATT